MFETILAPLDGSKLAEQALPYVTGLARGFDSEVTLIGVCEPEESEQSHACQMTVELEADGLRKALAGSQARVKTVVFTARPAQQIVEYAEKNKMGVIVLTSHGRSGLAPWSLGSTVQRVMHLRSAVPLLLVKAQESPQVCEGLFDRVLMPLDGSALGEAAVPHVVELSRKSKTEVVLFHVVEEGRQVHAKIGGLEYVPLLDRDVNVAKADAEKYLKGIAARFAGTKASVSTEVRVGEAAREILKLAGEKSDCLIAMASHGHTGLEAWTFGSVTYKIVESTARPMFIVSVWRNL